MLIFTNPPDLPGCPPRPRGGAGLTVEEEWREGMAIQPATPKGFGEPLPREGRFSWERAGENHLRTMGPRHPQHLPAADPKQKRWCPEAKPPSLVLTQAPRHTKMVPQKSRWLPRFYTLHSARDGCLGLLCPAKCTQHSCPQTRGEGGWVE